MPYGISQSPEELLSTIKSYAKGLIKGNTADTLGAPVDIVNQTISPVTKALGIYSDVPVGGSKSFRKLLNQSSEDSNLAETAGSMVSVGGAVKAMIVGAARLSKAREAIDIPKAMQMLAKDSPVADIYNQTGVYVDRDKILKSVISDKNVKVNPDAFEVLGGQLVPRYPGGKPVKLSEVISAPEHFALYPELKDIPVRLDEIGRGGSIATDNSKLTIQSVTPTPEGYDALKKILLHETQHGIQHIEGFAQGSSPSNFIDFDVQRLQNVVTKARKSSDPTVRAAAERLKASANAKLAEANNRYKNVAGEQEARFTESTQNLSEQEIASTVLQKLKEGVTPQTWDTRLIRPINPP